MSVKKLKQLVADTGNFLCVGLDPDVAKLPDHFLKSAHGVTAFLHEIIEATKDVCVAYKMNFAFFEALGSDGWKALEDVRNMIPSTHFIIADAKRGDIGNTAKKYAEAIFGVMDFDAVTLSPYMGRDVADPFLAYENKTSILLALTSNQGSADFQQSKLADGRMAYEEVLEKSSEWGSEDQLMYVVGATKPTYFTTVRKYVPNHFLLVPGVGAQGGKLEDVVAYGATANKGLLINSSRGILYASAGRDFAEAAHEKAKTLHDAMIQI